MTNQLLRANIQRYSSNGFDEYGDPNPIYSLQVNEKKFILKTRGKKLPSGIDFSQKYEFIFEINADNEIVAFNSPMQHLKWGNQSHIKTLAGSKRPKTVYQFVSGSITDKRSKTEVVNTHLPRYGMKGSTLERRTTYFINISGRALEGSSSYAKVKTGDRVTGVTNQYNYLVMLKNTQTGKTYGLFPVWPVVITLLLTVVINGYFLMDESLNEPVQTVFGEYPTYYEKMVFFNLAAIPISIMMILWTKERFKILKFHKSNTE